MRKIVHTSCNCSAIYGATCLWHCIRLYSLQSLRRHDIHVASSLVNSAVNSAPLLLNTRFARKSLIKRRSKRWPSRTSYRRQATRTWWRITCRFGDDRQYYDVLAGECLFCQGSFACVSCINMFSSTSIAYTSSSSSSWRRRKQAISGLYIREIHLES